MFRRWLQIVVVVLLCAPLLVTAKSFNVGGRQLDLIAPDGMAEVPSDFSEIHAILDLTVPAVNRKVSFYLANEDLAAAAVGGPLKVDRFAMVQVNRRGEAFDILPLHFAMLRETMRKDQAKYVKAAEPAVRSAAKGASDHVSKQTGIEMNIAVDGLTTFPSHINSPEMYAFSIRGRQNVQVGNYSELKTVHCTSTMIVLKNRLVYLYVYGGEDDLEWTRAASLKWARDIISANRRR